MKPSRRKNILLMFVAFVVTLTLSLWYFRVPTVPLTRETLQAARQQWEQAGVRDYDISYRMHGSRYDVQVRDGVVVDLLVDGKEARSAEWGLYSVDGLFKLLGMELENLADAQGAFGSKNTAMIARVRFDEKYGYVERYLRSAAPGGRPASIEVLVFRPHPGNDS